MAHEILDFKKKKITPLGNKVLAKPINPDLLTKSGLVIPEYNESKIYYATVVSFGKGYFKKDGGYHPLDYKVGDIIFYGKGERQQINIYSEIHVILKDEDILGIYKGKKSFLQTYNA